MFHYIALQLHSHSYTLFGLCIMKYAFIGTGKSRGSAGTCEVVPCQPINGLERLGMREMEASWCDLGLVFGITLSASGSARPRGRSV